MLRVRQYKYMVLISASHRVIGRLYSRIGHPLNQSGESLAGTAESLVKNWLQGLENRVVVGQDIHGDEPPKERLLPVGTTPGHRRMQTV